MRHVGEMLEASASIAGVTVLVEGSEGHEAAVGAEAGCDTESCCYSCASGTLYEGIADTEADAGGDVVEAGHYCSAALATRDGDSFLTRFYAAACYGRAGGTAAAAFSLRTVDADAHGAVEVAQSLEIRDPYCCLRASAEAHRAEAGGLAAGTSYLQESLWIA